MFGTSLGCHSASHLYNDTHTLTLDAAMHPERFDHGVDFRGDAVGTVTITSASADSSNVRYEITLRSNDKDLLQKSIIRMPALDDYGHLFESMAVLTSPRIPKSHPNTCFRYDVKILVPPSLKSLHLASHTRTHVKFDEKAKINMEGLFVTLFTNDKNNIIQSSRSIKANTLNLQTTRGWLVGDIAIVDETNLSTQRGDAILHVHVHPEPPRDKSNPELAAFDTTTGAGKTNVVIHSNEGMKRPIDATHTSSRNGPMKLTYKNSGFDGLLRVQAKELEAVGMEKLDSSNVQKGEKWNYFVRDKDGKDRIRVNSRGRVELYF